MALEIVEFNCETCNISCIKWKGSKVVTEPFCFDHCSEAESLRRRHHQLSFMEGDDSHP